MKRLRASHPPKDSGVNGVDDWLFSQQRENDTGAAIQAGLELLRAAQTFEKAKLSPSSNFELVTEGEKRGVYFTDDNGERFLVCSPLEIIAETQTASGTNYGRLLRWKDSQGRTHTWAMPIEFVHSEGAELAKYLSSNGLEIMPTRKHRERLAFYIATSNPAKKVATCAAYVH